MLLKSLLDLGINRRRANFVDRNCLRILRIRVNDIAGYLQSPVRLPSVLEKRTAARFFLSLDIYSGLPKRVSEVFHIERIA
jgi:hypothetical protein